MLQQIHCLVLALGVFLNRVSGVGTQQAVDADQGQLVQGASIVTTWDPQWQSRESSHEEERARLLGRIDRGNSQWDDKHPRWKLLEALHGFDRYKEITTAEIDRFEGLYKHVPMHHKKVRARAQWCYMR